MNFKKKTILLLPLLLTMLFSCNGQNNNNSSSLDSQTEVDSCASEPIYHGEDIEVSKIISNEYGRNIEVEGKDFIYLGTQIRVDAFMNCDKYTYADIKYLFKEAAALGVNCIQVPVEWSKIEFAQDEFNFKYVHEMLSYANEYDLKVEIMWYGSNMCGDTHSYSVPNYILADGRTYPKFDALRTGEFWNYYGILWYLDFDHPNLVSRETNAVRKLMDYIYTFDSTHGGKKPVIGVQIENEPDAFPRWRIDQYEVKSPTTGAKMTMEEGFEKVCNSVDALGKEVKNAKYKVYTRVNFANATNGSVYTGSIVNDAPSYVKKVNNLEGIDIVGDDCYMSSVRNVKGIINMFNSLPNNFGHIAENAGNYQNTPSLILAALAQHGGYSIYDLMTSPFFIQNGSGDVNQGIIDPGETANTFVYKNHYEETKLLISGLKMVESEIYKLDKDNVFAFNVTSDYPSKSKNQSISSKHSTIEFTTSQTALGFGLDFGSYIDLFLTHDASIKLSNGTITEVHTGSLLDDVFTSSGSVTFNNNTVNISGGQVYRITYTSSGPIESTTCANIGVS